MRRLEVHHVVAIGRACTSAPCYLPTLYRIETLNALQPHYRVEDIPYMSDVNKQNRRPYIIC